MDDAAAELGKSEGRIIHHVSGQTTGLRFTEHSLLTELLMGIIVKKDGKPIWSSVLSNHYHRRTEFTENISNSRISHRNQCFEYLIFCERFLFFFFCLYFRAQKPLNCISREDR